MASSMFKFLKRLGFNYSESQYADVTFIQILKKVFVTIRNSILLNWFMESALLSPILPRLLRPKILRTVGCTVGEHVFIGAQVYIDSGHAELIEIEDYVHVTARCLLLCHQRDLAGYRRDDNASKFGYKLGKITLKKGSMIGMNSVIMPGVTVGEGAIIGAFSLVTKDIPAWTIATGRPAKVVKHISERQNVTSK